MELSIDIKNRGYGFGARNPSTLPDGTTKTEGFSENVERTRFWKSLGRNANNGNLTGAKYV
jgi:hypothetical protein